MKLSIKGADAIKRYEGCVLKAYLCPAKVWTIGYGHTGSEVREGLTWLQHEANAAFLKDVARFESGVETVTTQIISQQQFDALVSLAFNIGMKAYQDSTLLKKLNSGDHVGAACQFARWNKVNGQYNEGLALRRASELYTFARGCPE
jgi:lysozyme